jgi:hypothetical protein
MIAIIFRKPLLSKSQTLSTRFAKAFQRYLETFIEINSAIYKLNSPRGNTSKFHKIDARKNN